MGAKPLSVTQRQVTAILKGAAAAGVLLEIRAEKGVVQFVPATAKEERVDSKIKGYL